MMRAELVRLLRRRNAANTPDGWTGRVAKMPGALSLSSVIAFLRAVAAGKKVDNETTVACFCGAAGLVGIRGYQTVITPDGIEALA